MLKQETLTVSALNRKAKQLLEIHFPKLLVTGEISNLARPSSGHWYFSLKDPQAQIRCAMFRSKASGVTHPIKEGDQVLIQGSLSLYEPRGDYQFIVERMTLAGEGALQAAFEALKAKLRSEGLFESHLKRPIPEHPQRVGMITSATGAAIQDVLTVLKRRAPHIEITVYPALVQGKEAPQDLIHALNLAYEHAWADVLIIGRGGGSLEDLWAFNDEALARKMFDSPIPIISAVGHETDFTIADFVADLRAATPSAAAELVALDRDQLLKVLGGFEEWLHQYMQRLISNYRQNLLHLQKRLKHPKHQLREYAQRLDRLEMAMVRGQRRKLSDCQNRLQAPLSDLLRMNPRLWLQSSNEQLNLFQTRINTAIQRIMERNQQALQHQVGMLNALSPLNTLNRGFGIMLNQQNRPITSHTDVKQGERLYAQLKHGHLTCEVIDADSTSKLPIVDTADTVSA